MEKYNNKRTAIQLCHGYKMPFFDVAQQYTHTLQQAGYRVVTIFLTGPFLEDIQEKSLADKTIFFERTSKQIKGLKIALIKNFNDICKSEQADLIVAHRPKAIYLSCMCASLGHKTKVIGVIHAYGDFERNSRKLLAYFSRKQLRLVGVSNAIRDDIRKSLPLFPINSIQTFYNRLDFDAVRTRLFTRQQARKKLGIGLGLGEYALVNIGRLHADKDQKTLIAAFSDSHKEISKNRKCHLYIIGEGKLRERLEQQIAELKAEDIISLLGLVPDAMNYLRAFDGFILSSDHEPFGMVLLEAIAAGLPIVTTDCGGALEINQSEYFFKVGDKQGLSKRLLKLEQLDDDDLNVISKKNLSHAKANFSFKTAEDDFNKLIAAFSDNT